MGPNSSGSYGGGGDRCNSSEAADPADDHLRGPLGRILLAGVYSHCRRPGRFSALASSKAAAAARTADDRRNAARGCTIYGGAAEAGDDGDAAGRGIGDGDDEYASGYGLQASNVPFMWEESPGKPRRMWSDGGSAAPSADPSMAAPPAAETAIRPLAAAAAAGLLRLPPMLESSCHPAAAGADRRKLRGACCNARDVVAIAGGSRRRLRRLHEFVPGWDGGGVRGAAAAGDDGEIGDGRQINIRSCNGSGLNMDSDDDDDDDDGEGEGEGEGDDPMMSFLDAPPSPWILGFSPPATGGARTVNSSSSSSHGGGRRSSSSRYGMSALLQKHAVRQGAMHASAECGAMARMRDMVELLGLLRWSSRGTRPAAAGGGRQKRRAADMWSPALATYLFDQRRRETLIPPPPPPPHAGDDRGARAENGRIDAFRGPISAHETQKRSVLYSMCCR